MNRHLFWLMAIFALCFSILSRPCHAEQSSQQVITLTTSRAIGDSVRIKVVSQDAAPISVEGLSEGTLVQDYKKYEIKNQTIVVRGPVLFLAVFNNGITTIECKDATTLDRIDCEENMLTELDLTEAPNIRQLFCHKNRLRSLNVSACSSLEWLNCSENELTTLDVSGNSALGVLVCADNKLTSLDTKSLVSLQNLECEGNQLTSLDLSANKALRGAFFQNNQLKEVRLAGCQRLETIYASKNKLTELDLSGLAKLKELRCYENELTKLSFAETPLVKTIYLECNAISEREMIELMHSLPTVQLNPDEEAKIGVCDLTYPKEQNVCNKTAVGIATEKHWSVVAYNGQKYAPYEGSDNTATDIVEWRERPLVYPTEVTDRLFISQALRESEFPIVIHSMEGKEMLRITDGIASSLDVSGLPKGIYIVSSGSLSTHFIKM